MDVKTGKETGIMMTVGSVTGKNSGGMQGANSGINMQEDSVSRNIKNQIARANEKLQELSANQDMTMEQKMKKRQEIQQEITVLNQQLRQHQIEQRKEAQSKKGSGEDMPDSRRADNEKAGGKGAGLTASSMEAMISADSSMKQARVHGSMAAQMEGRAGVVESEIKMDRSRGSDTEKKEEELADLKVRAGAAKAAQVSTLAEAGREIKEAAKAEEAAEGLEGAGGKNEKADNTKEAEDKEKSDKSEEDIPEAANDNGVKSGHAKGQLVHYTSIDVRL